MLNHSSKKQSDQSFYVSETEAHDDFTTLNKIDKLHDCIYVY